MENNEEHTKFEYNQITENIFLGTNACCTIHFDKELLDKGVRADISMEGEKLDAAEGAEYFLWLPTVDHEAPTVTKLSIGVHMIQELVDAKEKVYVHCKNGHGRGPSLVIAYFIFMGDDFDTAFKKVKEKRESIHLEGNQEEKLREFEVWCASHRKQKEV
jgi:protein-tyrosine phosphatase